MDNLFKKERDIILGESDPVIITVKSKIPFRNKTYEIKKQPITYGVFCQIVNCISVIGIPEEKSIKGYAKFVSENQKSITKIIAYALNDNPKKEPPKRLLDIIKNSMDVLKTIEVFYFIVEQCHIGDFSNAISYTGTVLMAEESEVMQDSSETS